MRALLLAAALVGVLAPASASTETDCRRMAQDEAVPEEDLAEYLAECLAMAQPIQPQAGAPESTTPVESPAQ